MICASCSKTFERTAYAAVKRPELCGGCWLDLDGRVTEAATKRIIEEIKGKANEMKIKSRIQSGICAVARCMYPSTGGTMLVDGAEVQVCTTHAQRASASLHDVSDPKVEVQAIGGAALETLELVDGFEIEGQDDLDTLAEVLADVKGKAKRLDVLKKTITDPLNESLRATRALFKEPEQRLADIEAKLKAAIAKYHFASAERNAAAIAEASAAVQAGADPSAAIAKIGAVANVPGVRVALSWDFEVTDPDKIPRELCSPDPAKIRAFVKECSEDLGEKTEGAEVVTEWGVRIFVRSTVSSRSS